MIPDYYKCGRCGAEGVKLFRKSATSEPVLEQPLLCGDCTVTEQGHTLNLAESDQCWGRCPAIPDLRGGWWGYTSVPAEGCVWWRALPLRLTGEWPVRGGVMRWVPLQSVTAVEIANRIRHVDFNREGGAVALVFLPTAEKTNG